ncbi:MAG: M48 family metallopeptidase [Bdellovibrionales bacterium]|nr:M48 family metallopeptidase [Bdellovibrionales bacterium]
MNAELDLGGIVVEVIRKDIKNIHLSVNPPNGKVRISAPESMELDAIRAFALSKLLWIKEQQRKHQLQERDIPREYLERESHWIWGKRYLLSIEISDSSPTITLTHDKLVVTVRPSSDANQIKLLMDEWYRDQIREALPDVLAYWEKILEVKVEKVFIQQMKTKWGGCTPGNASIRLNTELAKKPKQFLEYVVLHEVAHLVEPTHGERFQAIMDQCMPNWRQIRDELNRLPVPHGEWN